MKTRLLIISIIAIAVSIPTFWNDQAYALCTAEVNYDSALKNSELVFTGTVTRLDNYDGPQKVTFFIHDVIKGEIDTPKYILENSGLMFLENDTITSSSVSVDYKIGKTYKVYVENDQTNRCTTKITTPPADYMWAPGPEDGNYYSENPVWVDPCDEGYGLSDGVCITLEEMNKDLPTCSANPRHDFGKCKKNMEEPPNTFEQVKASCNNGGEDIFLEWWDDDVYYNNVKCDVLDRDKPGSRIQKQPPLKQFKAGSSFDEIQCKQNLVLIQKYDDSPACVTESTKTKLVERGWTNRLPPEIDLHSKERIAREAGYIGLLLMMQHIGQNQTVAVSLEGRPNLVMQMVDYYDIDIMSAKETTDGSFLSLFGNMTKPNLKKFFEDPMNNFAKRGILMTSLGGYVDDSGTHGPFNNFLTKNEALKIGKILEYYENKRANNEDTNWKKIIEWPTGKIVDRHYQEFVEHVSEDDVFEYLPIPQNDMYCWTQWWIEPTDIDKNALVMSIRETIRGFGPDVDISTREITVKDNAEETIVSIAGSWTKDKTQHQELTDTIKGFIGDSKINKDDLILCT